MNIKSFIKQLATVGAVAAALQAGSAMAGTVTLTFDDIATGWMTDAYEGAYGVTFGAGIGGQGANVQPYALSSATYPGLPSNFYAVGNQALFLNPTNPNDHVSNAPSTFAMFSQDVSNISMIFADTEIGSMLGRMIAFNAADEIIADTGDVLTPNNAYPGFATLSLNVSGIRKIEFYTNWDGAVVDNLKYTVADVAEVPEPASLALLGLGLAGIAGFGKRRKAKAAA